MPPPVPIRMRLTITLRPGGRKRIKATIRSGRGATTTEPIWQVQRKWFHEWFKRIVRMPDDTQRNGIGGLSLGASGSNFQWATGRFKIPQNDPVIINVFIQSFQNG